MTSSNGKRISSIVLTLSMLGAMMFVIAPPVLATGSHSASYSHIICAFTGSHQNNGLGTRPVARTSYSDTDCNRSTVKLKYQFGGDTVWTSTSYWYGDNWQFGASNSTTVQSRHQARYGSSWSPIKNLY